MAPSALLALRAVYGWELEKGRKVMDSIAGSRNTLHCVASFEIE